MTSPLKPWELRRVEEHSTQPSVRFRIPPGTSQSKEDMDQRSSPPPIPSRQRNIENRSSVQPYGSHYNNYGMHGGYNGYSGYGMGYSPYGMYNRQFGYGSNNMAPSTFARRAEDSCQPAFDSVQSVVQAFASIATMLDSTFFAVHSSFRAVLGVADQLSSLKTHITNTLGAIAIFKAIRYVFRKILHLLRLRNGNDDSYESELWNDAAKDVAEKQVKKATKSWPVVLFFAVVLGTPWIIWKLLQTISGDQESEAWMTGKGHSEYFEAMAEYDFDAENDDEVSCQEGDLLHVAPKHKQPNVRGWLLATVDGKMAGLVPANHIKILGRRRGVSKKKVDEMNKEVNERTYEQSYDTNNIEKDEQLNELFETQNSET